MHVVLEDQNSESLLWKIAHNYWNRNICYTLKRKHFPAVCFFLLAYFKVQQAFSKSLKKKILQFAIQGIASVLECSFKIHLGGVLKMKRKIKNFLICQQRRVNVLYVYFARFRF